MLAAKNYTVETAEDGGECSYQIDRVQSRRHSSQHNNAGFQHNAGFQRDRTVEGYEYDREYKVISALMLSAMSEMRRIIECLDIGAVGYITKESSV